VRHLQSADAVYIILGLWPQRWISDWSVFRFSKAAMCGLGSTARRGDYIPDLKRNHNLLVARSKSVSGGLNAKYSAI